jgi:hypothetical protein
MYEYASPFVNNSLNVAGLELTTYTDCLKSYKIFTCKYNFPLCDGDTGETYFSCPTDCSVFKTNCGMDSSLCSSKFFDQMLEGSKSCDYAPQDPNA